MKLLPHRILFHATPKTDSLIITPDQYKKEDDGEVILIGEEVDWLKVGDKIRKFHNSKGIEIDYNGKTCLMLDVRGDIELKL